MRGLYAAKQTRPSAIFNHRETPCSLDQERATDHASLLNVSPLNCLELICAGCVSLRLLADV